MQYFTKNSNFITLVTSLSDKLPIDVPYLWFFILG